MSPAKGTRRTSRDRKPLSAMPMVERRGKARQARRRPHRLEPADIRPLIRIAHRMRHALNVGPRMIVDHELVLILRGEGTLTLGGQALTFRPHQLWLFEPFVPHQMAQDSATAGEHVAVHFDLSPTVPPRGANLARRTPYRVALTDGLHWPTCTQLAPGHRIETLLLELLRVRESGRPWAELESSLIVGRVLVDLLRQSESRQHDDAGAVDAASRVRLERAVQAMRQRLHEPLDVASLASIAGLSPSHFQRLFNQWTGFSPMRYLRRLRIERARELLADPDLSVKQVAQRVGVPDPFHFSRLFRALDGLSPSEFRAAALAGRRPPTP